MGADRKFVYSGGHVKNIGKAVTTSCTNRLLEWNRSTLRPAGVTLTILLPKIYRAHWEDDGFHKTADEKKHYGARAEKSREGLKLLLAEPGRTPPAVLLVSDHAYRRCFLQALMFKL